MAREFRGVWVATVNNIDWPSRPGLSSWGQRQELLAILDHAAALRLNAVIFQVRAAADAFYDSPYEPWSEYLTGQQGLAPEPAYDPLRFTIEEAHARGLELHAWINPFRAFHADSEAKDTALTHVTMTGAVAAPQYGGSRWMDPGDRRVREHSLRVIRDIVRRYDVDGVHIDDYFYPYPVKDATGAEVDFPDAATYADYVRRGGSLARDDWRRDNVDTFVREMYRAVHEVKPRVKVGISPSAIWRPRHPAQVCCFDPYASIYADSRKWLQNGWLDYFMPQLYSAIDTVSQSYPVLLDWWARQNTMQRHLWPGMYTGKVGGLWVRPTDTWKSDEILRQVALTRAQRGATGHAHFSMRAFMIPTPDSLVQRLHAEAYLEQALVPASPWLDRSAPGAPAVRLVADSITGGRRLSLAPAAGDSVWLWTIQERRDGHWTSRILPGRQRSTALTRNRLERLPEAVWVSAVDRTGNQSRVVEVAVPAVVTVGADRLFGEFAHLIRGKRLALVSNHSGRLSDGTHLVDALHRHPDARLRVLFGMEYDIRSNDYSVPRDPERSIDRATGLPKFSLYGEHHMPTKEMLGDAQVIVFDIQEVGARFYEHINILGFAMEAAAEHGLEVVVLDRPNPITGLKQEGFLTDSAALYRFGSYAQVPVVHGMTMGELARLYVGARMLRGGRAPTLHVVPMTGWKREMWWDDTGMPFTKPSPNLPTLNSVLAYVGTCLFEAVNVSEGRGSDRPFEYIGAPWLDNARAVELLNGLRLPGVVFRPITFTPEQKAFHSRPPEYAGVPLRGVFIDITDRDVFDPYKVGVALLWAVYRLHPDRLVWNDATLDRLTATPRLKAMITSGMQPAEIIAAWQPEVAAFRKVAEPYLLYR